MQKEELVANKKSPRLIKYSGQILSYPALLLAGLFCFNFAYITNPWFNPTVPAIIIIYALWFVITIGSKPSCWKLLFRTTWPLLLWLAQVVVRAIIEQSLDGDNLNHAIFIAMAVFISFWYLNYGRSHEIKFLLILMILALFLGSIVSIIYSIKVPGIMRLTANSSLPKHLKEKGIATFGFVYSLVYIIPTVTALIYDLFRQRPLLATKNLPKNLKVKCVASIIIWIICLILWSTVLVLANFVMAYLFILIFGGTMFVLLGKRPWRRLSALLIVIAALWWPVAQLFALLAKHAKNFFLYVRFYELSELMQGRISIHHTQSAILARYQRFGEIWRLWLDSPFIGSMGIKKDLFFHQDFQWLSGLVNYGLFDLLLLWFLFQQWRRFVSAQIQSNFSKHMLTAIFSVVLVHGFLNRLFANDLLSVLIIFLPLLLKEFPLCIQSSPRPVPEESITAGSI